ncbi:SMI1/KNR4 family protein [Ottowia thiooxydans]|uniref:SMI1/KNR4 family protein n=1 Tax=Ottowia thiooxydans TaxID=219182 RepID=UPI00040AD5BF|nr:SMI1/KNR4 family protein [Ottowia thiooxydans]
MTAYTCHWIETAPKRKSSAPLLIQLTLHPNGYDGQAYWKRQEARTSAERFKMVEDLTFAADVGPQVVLQRFIELRSTLAGSGFQEVVAPDKVYGPGSIAGHRPKTQDECRMDLAALHTECGDNDGALAQLLQCQNSEGAWYLHTAARRAHANRARANPGPDADDDWTAALNHCIAIVSSAEEQKTNPFYMHTGSSSYYFGDSYGGAPSQLAAAAQTMAEYALCVADQPEQALQAIALADSTSSGTTQIEQYRVTALLQLGRNDEAHACHRKWSLRMPKVLNDPAYQAFVAGETAQANESERLRIDALKFEYAPGQSATAVDLDLLRQHFPAAMKNAACAAYVQWVSSPDQPHQLTVIDGEYRQAYQLFSIAQALEKHADMMDWLSLHDDSSPELASEIRQAIADDGIDPMRMLPIVGDEQSSDCFLLRTDDPHMGVVYYWSHDESTVFSPIVSNAEQLFPWLRAQAEAGDTFSL